MYIYVIYTGTMYIHVIYGISCVIYVDIYIYTYVIVVHECPFYAGIVGISIGNIYVSSTFKCICGTGTISCIPCILRVV